MLYILENEAYKYLPGLLEKDYGIKVKSELCWKYIEIKKDKYELIKIIGEAEENSEEVIILGECKAEFEKSDINKFINKVKRIKKVIDKREVLVIVAHKVHPIVVKYANKFGIKIYYSYQLK